jgi:enamine deaminase RidA (YjgF/YER057c/UK114 family)
MHSSSNIQKGRPSVETAFINLAKNKTRNIPGIKGTGIAAAFSDAVRVDHADHFVLYISGKLATDEDGNIVGRTMAEQAERALQNIKEILEQQGAGMKHIVRTLIFVTQIDAQSLREIHEVRARFFKDGRFPASTLVRTSQLVRDGGLIEIEAEAVVPR